MKLTVKNNNGKTIIIKTFNKDSQAREFYSLLKDIFDEVWTPGQILKGDNKTISSANDHSRSNYYEEGSITIEFST